MDLRLRKLTIDNFKGIRHAEYKFGDKVEVSGKNGSGKSTICDSILWVLFDKDYSLKSNPPIRPNDADDAIVPEVTLDFEVDTDKCLLITKKQKLKREKPDDNGVSKISMTNSYVVNEVPLTERDYQKRMAEYGIDMTKFMQMCHPDVFVGYMGDKRTRESMRDTLFQMASVQSDLEIASLNAETADLRVELAKGHTIAEVEAMANASIRQIRENYGKDGEILRAQIAGLESAKVDMDVAELELQRNVLKEQLEEVRKQTNDGSIIADLKTQINEIEYQLSTRKMELTNEANEAKAALSNQIIDAEAKQREFRRTMLDFESQYNTNKRTFDKMRVEIKEFREEFERLKNTTFDQTKKICPTCGQMLPESQIEKMVSDFDKRKEEKIKADTELGNEKVANFNELAKVVNEQSSKLAEYQRSCEEADARLAKLRNDLMLVPDVNLGADKAYVELLNKKEFLSASLRKAEADAATGNALANQRIAELTKQIDGITGMIAQHQNNDAIDEKIGLLHEKQIQYEQAKADAEKMQYQISVLNKLKNDMLQDSVNSHFKLVKWKLWDRQKNGEYISTCVPTIDGKDFGTAMNTGLEIKAKLDVLEGLQEFFGSRYPILLDNAENLDSEARYAIQSGSQLIMLRVTDGELEVSND